MPDNHDPLSQLWQEQVVQKPDLDATHQQWKKITIKQRLYVIFDLLSLLPFFVIFIYFKQKLDDFTLFYLWGMGIISLLFVGYLIWLRRFSLGWSVESTEQYTLKLRKQLLNNIKIAWLSKHSMWVLLILISFHHLGLFFFEVFPTHILLRKAALSFLFITVTGVFVWKWAHKRGQRFTDELAALDALIDASQRDAAKD